MEFPPPKRGVQDSGRAVLQEFVLRGGEGEGIPAEDGFSVGTPQQAFVALLPRLRGARRTACCRRLAYVQTPMVNVPHVSRIHPVLFYFQPLVFIWFERSKFRVGGLILVRGFGACDFVSACGVFGIPINSPPARLVYFLTALVPCSASPALGAGVIKG